MPDINAETVKMMEQIAVRAAKAAVEEERRSKVEDSEEFRDRRLRNTKKLLENYRRLRKHAESAVYSSMQEKVEDIIQKIWDPGIRSEQIVFSIKTSVTRTNLIMAHVNAMIEEYRRLCYASPDLIDRDRADALFARYIDDNELTVEEIAEKLCVSVRTVHRYLKQAIDEVSAFMFGIDGIVTVKKDFDSDE